VKIVTVIGARPQFIKAATVSRIIANNDEIKEIVIHTGQHYDHNLSKLFFEELEINEPEYNLGIGGRMHGSMTGRQLEKIEEILLNEKPDWVLVYGDTNSTLAGALAAAKLHIPVAHVEAGLRSFNKNMPEEINRVLTDHISTILYTPTDSAINNLLNEGILHSQILPVGDVMYDAALYFKNKAELNSQVLDEYSLTKDNYVLCTIHRAENTDNPSRMKALLEGLGKVARSVPVVLPLHPRTRTVIEKQGIGEFLSGVNVLPPVGYLDMVMLERHAKLIATDSGGIQKEAFFYEKPCITLRDETEWVELIELGWNTLITPDNADAVAKGIIERIGTTGRPGQPFGHGNAAELIVDRLIA
jgi:UDP-GlcNAc3NAcA epimerase